MHEIGSIRATVLAVTGAGERHDPIAEAARRIGRSLEASGVELVRAESCADALAVVRSDTSLQAIVADWELDDNDAKKRAKAALEFLNEVRGLSADIPIFLAAERTSLADIPLDVIRLVDDYVWIMEDTADFIAGRILAAMRRYQENMLPPMFAALVDFAQTHEYSWHTPGHTGGTAFLRAPAGRAFFDFFGEEMLRSDLSISVAELGSLLDHSGPIGAAERYAAKVFGSDLTYFVTNGSSTSNRVCFQANVVHGDMALLDRNCHKSVEQATTQTGAVPIYLMPERNRFGIIGPIPQSRLEPEGIKKAIKASKIKAESSKPVHAMVTNSTYDGLTYNVAEAAPMLGLSVDRIHWDEAWYGYARFNPLYEGRYSMHRGARSENEPTQFATQSTHKLLAALSQASMLHIRQGRVPVEPGLFNEAFMAHASTSPQYAIIASNDVTTKMMEGRSGERLTRESIDEAVSFRKTMARIAAETGRGDWWFEPWQPPRVPGPKNGPMPFHEAPDDWLATQPECWMLEPGAPWHGFDGYTDGWVMLDPIKVTLITPGMGDDGEPTEFGIPAPLVTKYLDGQGIVVEKTGDNTILFLFSMGITKGKWGTLLTALLDFKDQFDANAPLDEVLPELVQESPGRYQGEGLADLAAEMHGQMRSSRITALQSEAFSTLPIPAMKPSDAYVRMVRGEVEQVALDQLGGRTVATGVVPYPPGIPMLMPGENAGGATGPVVGYLKAMRDFDRLFPGFDHDTHGVEVKDDEYFIYCLKEKGR
ncbi:MAG TPA: Orn/Lys/Arg decarboxylase N-terminal domain-containing protein [Acidimicrobiales bacterium]